MSESHDNALRRPERESRQPLAKMDKGDAKSPKPDPELGEHGPIVSEPGRNEDGKPGH